MTTYSALKLYFPYCIERVPSGKYVVLNRQYKPLGIVTQERIDYEPYAVKLKITSEIAAKLSWSGSNETSRIWLYRGTLDVEENWAGYSERLKYFSEKVCKQ